MLTLKHVPIGQHNLAHEDGVVHHVGDVHRVARFVRRVKVVARSRQRARLEVINVLRGVTHTVDDAIIGEMRPHGLFQRRVHAPGKCGTAAVFVPQRADDGLRVHLDAINVRRGEIIVRDDVKVRQSIGTRHSDPAHGERIPRLGRFHGQHSRRMLGILHHRSVLRDVFLIRMNTTPIPEQRVPTVHVLHPKLGLDLTNHFSEPIHGLGFGKKVQLRRSRARAC